jgi:hypothetical protein
VIPSKKPTATQIKEDKIGKAAYHPVLKDLMGSRPTLEQVESMINEPMKQRGKQIYRFCQAISDNIQTKNKKLMMAAGRVRLKQ